MICPECGNPFQPRNGRSGRKRCWDCWFKEYRERKHADVQAKSEAEQRKKTCRHCHNHSANRPLGLCWSCYYTPGVRELYPSTSKFGRRGAGVCGHALPEPTEALPGTPEKMAVLEERARRGLALWHPGDNSGLRETPGCFAIQGSETEDSEE